MFYTFELVSILNTGFSPVEGNLTANMGVLPAYFS